MEDIEPWEDTGYQSDFYYIGRKYDCDPNCWFNQSIVNSSTITLYPINCTTVCGNLNFGKESDIPVFDVSPYFVNLRRLNGALTFSQTLYRNAEFLSSLTEVYCDHQYGTVTFGYNRLMEEIRLDNLENVTCTFYAYNNPKLDMKPICEQFADTETVLLTYDNMQNCDGCIGGKVNVDNVKNFKNCTSVYGGMYITDTFISSGTDMSGLNLVENMTGTLESYMNDVKNFEFFKSLKRVKSKSSTSSGVRYNMKFEQSFNMTGLGMENLQELKSMDISGKFYVAFTQLHPDFCLKTTEMQLFMQQNVEFSLISEVRYCVNETRKDQKTICVFQSMSSLPNDCTLIRGKVLIQAGDENQVEKLEAIEYIFGTLTVQNTQLKNLNFLGNLNYVAALNDSDPAIQIISNSILEDTSIPKLKRAFSTSKYQIEFKNNRVRSMNSSMCSTFRDHLYDTAIAFDGFECEVIGRIDTKDNGSSNKKYYSIPLLIKIFILIYFL